MSIEKARWAIKRSSVAGVVPTVPSVSTDKQSGWVAETDIYEGELFLNTTDKIVYTRAGSTIVQLGGTISVYDELSDLEDVTISATPSNGSGFIYSTASNTWVPSTVLNIDENLHSVYQETCVVSGVYSSALCFHTEASGDYSFAEGGGASASGNYSHAEGQNTNAEGDESHAEGLNTTASGAASHAEGNFNTASGAASHAEGFSNTASGAASHAEGSGNESIGIYSHSEGVDNTSSGKASHTEGIHNIASATASHSKGSYSSSFRENQMAHGGGVIDAIGDAQFCRMVYKIQTTDNLETTIATFNTETNHIYGIRILGMGVVKVGTNVGSTILFNGYSSSIESDFGYIKNIGGTVTTNLNKMLSMPKRHGTDSTFPSSVDYITVSVSGTDILFKVIGVASNTINWVLTLEWTETII